VRLGKRITQSESLSAFLAWLAAWYIRAVFQTLRWTINGLDQPRAYHDRGQGFIFCFWHGRMMMLPAAWHRSRRLYMLISDHRDGRFIAKTIRHLGVATVVGSSSRGGAQALRAILKLLKAGLGVGFTPDGPRGPRMRASLGVVQAARLSGAPIFPLTYSTSRRRLFASWDRFLLPLPFGRGVLLVGTPIRVARDADDAALERARADVEERLNQLTREADKRCGWPPVEPAPLPVRDEGSALGAAASGGAFR
jgi:lysophospholipid acyltransferase (LPLAT)-like uncharacterized protein